jgi:hypothetical protein
MYLTLRKEHELGAFENRMLSIIFGPERGSNRRAFGTHNGHKDFVAAGINGLIISL